MTQTKRVVAHLVIACFLSLSLPLHSVHAALIGTDQILAQSLTPERERVLRLLEREDVRAGLQAQGIGAAEAQARVQAMSDEEVQALAGRLDQAPAGAGVLGVLFAVFIVLLVTDILGYTKVFPFTRPIER